jgi:hypothetical protein
LLRRSSNEEILLLAGDEWAQEPHVVYLEESQVEFVRWFSNWLAARCDGDPTDWLALVSGDRRCGMTFTMLACAVARLVDVPAGMPTATTCAVISPTARDRDEVDQTLRQMMPTDWWYSVRYLDGVSEYRLANGGVLLNLPEAESEALKRGRFELVVYNDAQRLNASTVARGILGVGESGGLVLVAAGPPRTSDTWVTDLKQAIEDASEPGGRAFMLSSKQNTKIDAPARRRVGRLAAIVDPSEPAGGLDPCPRHAGTPYMCDCATTQRQREATTKAYEQILERYGSGASIVVPTADAEFLSAVDRVLREAQGLSNGTRELREACRALGPLLRARMGRASEAL